MVRTHGRSFLTASLVLMLLAGFLPACGPSRLSGGDPDEKAREAAKLGVTKANENIPILLLAIKEEPDLVQATAIVALGRIGTPEAVAALRQVAQQESASLKVGIAQALADVLPESYPAAAEVLVEMGKAALPQGGKDPSREIRRAVTTALAVVRQPAGLDFMLDRAVNDTDENIRNASVMTLGRMKDPRATEALIRIAREDNEKNRAWAVEGLGMIGDPRGLPAVEEALADFDAVTRGKAAWSLMQMKGQEAIPPLKAALEREQDDLPAVVMLHALALLGVREAVPDLETRVQQAPSYIARAEAARALKDVGRAESIPVLDRVFDQDRDGLVKKEAGDSIRALFKKFPEEEKKLLAGKSRKPAPGP